MQLGVFGGCFDPPHTGHLAVVEAALRTAGLDQVLVVPAAVASGNEPGIIASPADRLNMCSLCFRSEPRCVISDIELRHEEWTPTIDTIEKLQKQYRHDQLTLIIGADKLISLPKWKCAEELFRLCDILVCPRDGVEWQSCLEPLRAQGANIRVLDVPEAPGASSAAQDALHRYQDPPELTPDVTAYIAEHWLYLDQHILTAESMMTPKRWRHTLGVRQEALRLCRIHGVSQTEAALAALLHDCAKCLPFEEMLLYAREAHITDPTFLSSPALLHGPVGAYLARTEFGIDLPDVLSAITYHTVGRSEMSKLDMIIFVADATEPGREKYPGLRRLRRLAEQSLEAAVLLSLNLTKQYVLSSGKPFNPISDATIRWVTPMVPQELLPLTSAGLP